jgi:protein-S-isoprenylcysteine O-methyltransferase Ste14
MSGGPFAEKEPTQRLIMALMSIGFLALLVVPALDRRLGWSRMPDWVAILGDVVMTLGWLGIHFVFRVNTYTAATIQLAEDQHVISTGPYAVIRHPMYAGALLMLGGIPIALGSWWGFLVFLALLPGLAWRIVDEERFLIAHLKGYAEYRQTVRYRMIPGVW